MKKNQTGFVPPKTKPITKKVTGLKPFKKLKPASNLDRVETKSIEKKSKNRLAIGTGVYLYNLGKRFKNQFHQLMAVVTKFQSETT